MEHTPASSALRKNAPYLSSVLVSGYSLMLIGFEPGKEIVQTPAAVWRLCAVTLLVGPAISLASLVLIRRYPVNNELLNTVRAKKASATRIDNVLPQPAGQGGIE